MQRNALQSLIIKPVESDWEMEAAYALRRQVFVEEQGVPMDIEVDDLDATAVHAIAIQDGIVVATGRLLKDTPVQGLIGRMAVARTLRRQGIGGSILALLEDEARSRGITHITLHAQSYVKEFYAGRGYQEEGEHFMEAGIQHILMRKALS